eukprot:9464935-Pyramimonas_sp.AAC.1
MLKLRSHAVSFSRHNRALCSLAYRNTCDAPLGSVCESPAPFARGSPRTHCRSLVPQSVRHMCKGSEVVDSETFAGQYHSPVTEQLWRERVAAASAQRNNAVTSSDKGVTRKPSETRTQLKYQFSSDSKLRDAYRNPWGYIRHGMLLEDLDALAGNIAFKHCNHPSHPSPMLVTASVDSIKMLQRLRLDHDVTLSGEVEW